MPATDIQVKERGHIFFEATFILVEGESSNVSGFSSYAQPALHPKVEIVKIVPQKTLRINLKCEISTVYNLSVKITTKLHCCHIFAIFALGVEREQVFYQCRVGLGLRHTHTNTKTKKISNRA